jgi:thioredoxin-like negative regulator of GroEL
MEINISPSQGARFDAIVQEKPCVAKFHSPNCHYCVELAPIWKSVLKSPQIAKSNTTFLNVNYDAISNINSKCAENIVGVPTIMIVYNKGKSRKLHNAANDLDSILQFLNDNANLLQQHGGRSQDKKTRRKKHTTKKRSSRKKTTKKYHSRKRTLNSRKRYTKKT